MGWRGWIGAALLVLSTSRAGAADKVEASFIGALSAPSWPYLIAQDKGYFAEAEIQFDISFAPNAPGVMQQLAAGSVDMASTGAAEPILAFGQGAPVAVLRVMGQSAPYELIGKKDIAGLRGLKGKTVIIGGRTDITGIYWSRMAAAAGLGKSDYDLIFGGSTGARFAALKAGSADAAMLNPPINFHAKEQGYVVLASALDYARDLIFGALSVNRGWAAAHADTIKRLDAALTRATLWFEDPANHDEAIKIMVAATHSTAPDAEASYDFFRRTAFFETTGTVSLSRLQNLIDAQKKLGDVPQTLTAAQVIMPGITETGP
ncbi:MAG TPA: ABC transporter substrate-binding protein [Stellaceae bacterium]|nr:ABC transporter substrate-binding protein [Stellaceae bacterium]